MSRMYLLQSFQDTCLAKKEAAQGDLQRREADTLANGSRCPPNMAFYQLSFLRLGKVM